VQKPAGGGAAGLQRAVGGKAAEQRTECAGISEYRAMIPFIINGLGNAGMADPWDALPDPWLRPAWVDAPDEAQAGRPRPPRMAADGAADGAAHAAAPLGRAQDTLARRDQLALPSCATMSY
jgi:hypothetical protein